MGHLVTRWHQRGALLFPGVCLCVRNINRLGRVAIGDHLSLWPLRISFLFISGSVAWEPPHLSLRCSPAATVQRLVPPFKFYRSSSFDVFSSFLQVHLLPLRQWNRAFLLSPSGSKHPPVAFAHCFYEKNVLFCFWLPYILLPLRDSLSCLSAQAVWDLIVHSF